MLTRRAKTGVHYEFGRSDPSANALHKRPHGLSGRAEPAGGAGGGRVSRRVGGWSGGCRRLASLFAQPAGFPFLRKLLELSRELIEGIVEGEDDLGCAWDVVAVE